MASLEDKIPIIGISWIDLIAALLILIIGYIVAKFIVNIFKRGLHRSNMPEMAADFLSRLLSIILYLAVLLTFISALGINVSSIVLGLSAAIGLIVGLGMQDTVANLTAGIWVAFLRPMDIGDFVTINGQSGTIRSVGLMKTDMTTPDNKFITIPNKMLMSSPVINFSRMDTRRAAVDVSISDKSDIDLAIKISIDLMQKHPKVLQEPAPEVVINGLENASFNLQLRCWTLNEDFWRVTWDLRANIIKEFREKGIETASQRVDVRITEN